MATAMDTLAWMNGQQQSDGDDICVTVASWHCHYDQFNASQTKCYLNFATMRTGPFAQYHCRTFNRWILVFIRHNYTVLDGIFGVFIGKASKRHERWKKVQ